MHTRTPWPSGIPCHNLKVGRGRLWEFWAGASVCRCSSPLSDKDAIFPVDKAHEEMNLFVGAVDKTLHVVPKAGHTLHLEPNAPETMAELVNWLGGRPAALPAC